MHPSKQELKIFVKNKLTDKEHRREIEEHLNDCEFCQEYCRDYTEFLNSLANTQNSNLPESANNLVQRLQQQALSSRTIILKPFDYNITPIKNALAADGKDDSPENFSGSTIFYSENPEIVLRVIYDPKKNNRYLQLLSDNEHYVSKVLIQAPELDLDIITDQSGKGELPDLNIPNPEKIKWQIKMAKAEFELKPLQVIEDKQSKEIILKSDNGDRIKICYKKKNNKIEMSVILLELNGEKDFGETLITVSCGELINTKNLNKNKSADFIISETEPTIHLQIFH